MVWRPLSHNHQSRLKKAGIPLTVYPHRSWNQSASPVNNKYSPYGAGGEKEVDSSSSQTSFCGHSNLLTLNPSSWLQELGTWTENGKS